MLYMRQFVFVGLVSLCAVVWVDATPLQYTNITGTITTPPQIDAISVLNSGYWYIDTYPWPFDMSNNRNFTNAGTMNCTVGFRFDNAPAGTGKRYLAANFHNRRNGSVVSGPDIYGSYYPNYLWISATNIVNEGLLSIGANGEMKLIGTNVDLRYSTLRVVPVQGIGSIGDTNSFDPDVAIYDEYWGIGTNRFDSSSLFTMYGQTVIAVSPSHFVYYPGGLGGYVRVGPFSALWGCYTNFDVMEITVTNIDGNPETIFLPTNIVKQAVFVGVADPSITTEIRFSPSSSPTNMMQTVAVGLTTTVSNAAGGSDLRAIYFVDTLASETNRGLVSNTRDWLTARPVNYIIQRTMPYEFAIGRPGNAQLTTNFLYDSSYSNRFVSGEYSGYAAFIDNVVSRPPAVPGGAVTNIPGRVTIIADSLDLTRTRVRAEGLIDIQTRHLVSSTNAVVDSEHLSFNLGSTNGFLAIQNLVPSGVLRFKGYTYAWSGLWSNSATVIVTNYAVDNTTNPPVVTPAFITNGVSIQLHVLMLDASLLSAALQPSYVFNFLSHSTNLVIRDYMTVTNIFLVEGRSMTIEGALELDYGLQSWHIGLAPNLRFFTNLGTFTVPNEAYFGSDSPTPYAAFVNRGTILSFGQEINSDYTEISGLNQAQGFLSLSTRSGKLEGGTLSSGYDTWLGGNTFKLHRGKISVGGKLYLSITNSLYDMGDGASNAITCGDGFYLSVKPQTGDLLGTTVNSTGPDFGWIEHTWAGADRGPTGAGFVDNVALGKLVLAADGRDLVFYFRGTGASNALYVDVLDISALGPNYANQLVIDPSLTVYFAAAKVGFTPPGMMQPEEYLDGQFGGRLRWVSSFAGPGSSAYVISNGVSIVVNRALRTSRILDSDGDGIPNYYDPYPFDPPAPRLAASLVETNQPPKSVLAISWEAQPFTAYQVEYTTNFPLFGWQPLLVYTNEMPASRVVTVWDTNAPAGAQRKFYRVKQLP